MAPEILEALTQPDFCSPVKLRPIASAAEANNNQPKKKVSKARMGAAPATVYFMSWRNIQ
jgi:hypothetical protein